MAKLIRKGGKGSGNWGHAGRPGKVGGSAPQNDVLQPSLFNRDEYIDIATAVGIDKLKVMDRSDLMGTTETGYNDYALEEYVRPTDQEKEDGHFRGQAVDAIAEDTGLDPDDIEQVIDVWANYSNGDYETEFIHRAAVAVFGDLMGTDLSDWQHEEFSSYSDPANDTIYQPDVLLFDHDGWTNKDKFEATKSVLAAMYDITQRKLKEMGVQGITLYRGVVDSYGQLGYDYKKNKTVTLDENALESWSLDSNVASRFAEQTYDQDEEDSPVQVGYVLESYFPAERILSMPRTGLNGNMNEMEFVVLNSSVDDRALIGGVYRHDTGWQ